jgi:DNA modification methylase
MYEYVDSAVLEDSWKNITNVREHSLHKLCSRTGSFPSFLAQYFVTKFSKPLQRVLDPFSGKGTTPLEACLNNRVGIGNDLSPEAYILTHSKVRCVPLKRIKSYLNRIRNKMRVVKYSIAEVHDDVRLFFHEKTLEQILALREILMHDLSDEGIFLKALLCGILHGRSSVSLSLPCSHSFSMSPNYVRKYCKEHNLQRPIRNVISCLEKKAVAVLADGLPKVKGEAYQSNATNLPLEDKSIDLIITSPPYFNKQTYAWDNWLRLWLLGYDYRDIRQKLFHSGCQSKFKDFMLGCLREMYRVLRDNSYCFIVVGDVRLRGNMINTASMVAELAEQVGFYVKRIINDSVPRNKKYFMFISSEKGIRMDRIVELLKE